MCARPSDSIRHVALALMKLGDTNDIEIIFGVKRIT
jgi:hypothetical protein